MVLSNQDFHEQENYEAIDIEDQKRNGNQAEASITSLMEELKKRQGNLDDNYLCPVDSRQSVMPVLESESGKKIKSYFLIFCIIYKKLCVKISHVYFLEFQTLEFHKHKN